jgi:hypothetical protein
LTEGPSLAGEGEEIKMEMKIVILESTEYDLKQLKDYLGKNFSVETW